MTVTAPEAPASKNARTSVVLSLQTAGITDEEQQRHICAVWARRPIGSRTELTEREARSLAARVKTMSRDELAAVLGRPAPEPAPELPPGMIACRPGTLTEHDAAQVRRFAEFLDQAGPPPTREELAAVREPAGLPPIGAFRLTPDGAVPVDVADLVAKKPEPFAVCPEDGAATCRAEPGECCMETPAASPEESADVVELVDQVEPEPPAPVPVPREPPPEDVEAAAEEAVRRYRERIAAGIVWTAPDLSGIPRRIPLQLGPAPGRYCLARCYCGTCPQYAEQRAEADRQHAREVRKALASPYAR